MTRQAATYRERRVLLAGDAAHAVALSRGQYLRHGAILHVRIGSQVG